MYVKHINISGDAMKGANLVILKIRIRYQTSDLDHPLLRFSDFISFYEHRVMVVGKEAVWEVSKEKLQE